MQTVIEAITAIRARRNEMHVAPSKKEHYTVATAHADTFSAGIPFFTRLASASDVTIVPADAAIDADGKVEVDTHAARIFMPLAELVDFEKELARIAKEKANAEKQLVSIVNKLKNEGFRAKAPEAVVNGARADAEKLRALIEKLDASAAAMKKKLLSFRKRIWFPAPRRGRIKGEVLFHKREPPPFDTPRERFRHCKRAA